MSGNDAERKIEADGLEAEEKDEKEAGDDKLIEDSKDSISEENDSKDESMDAGDVEYLQLAWENLEVARTICDK